LRAATPPGLARRLRCVSANTTQRGVITKCFRLAVRRFYLERCPMTAERFCTGLLARLRIMLITAAVFACASGVAQAVNCGDTITRNTTLSVDLTGCPGKWHHRRRGPRQARSRWPHDQRSRKRRWCSCQRPEVCADQKRYSPAVWGRCAF
jgi:hypothetical protein